MQIRWRGRTAGLAIGLVAVTAVLAAGLVVARSTEHRWLMVRDGSGEVILQHAVEAGDRIGLRYRNSLYGSLAEEWFTVTGAGQMRLERLAADERAVLEEYYVIDGPATSNGEGLGERAFAATPADRIELDELAVAATDLGQRTLLLPGQVTVDLWRLVGDEQPTVTLSVEGSGRR